MWALCPQLCPRLFETVNLQPLQGVVGLARFCKFLVVQSFLRFLRLYHSKCNAFK